MHKAFIQSRQARRAPRWHMRRDHWQRRLLYQALYVLFQLSTSVSAYLDVYHKHELEQLVANKTHIFMFSYVAGLHHMWTKMGSELAYRLHQLKYDYIVLTHDEASCDEVVRWFQPSPTCVLDSVLHKTHGYENSVLTLWVRRYHTCALLAEAKVICTMLDADTVILRDFKADLQKWHEGYAIVALGEGPVNGGMWSLRASNASSPGLWVIKQIERRSTLYEKYKVHDHNRDPGLVMDQIMFGDALRVASMPEGLGSAFDFWGDYSMSRIREHEMWQVFPQHDRGHGFAWRKTAELYDSPFLNDKVHPDFAKQWELARVPLQWQEMRVPFDAEEYDEMQPPEKILCAPFWLFVHGDPFALGNMDQYAVVHLLGVNKYWYPAKDGSHVGRYAQWLLRPGFQLPEPPETRKFVKFGHHIVHESVRELKTFRNLLANLFAYASETRRIPVVPAVACNLPWIVQSNSTELGYDDRHIIDDGIHCFAGPMGYDTNCVVNDHYVYEHHVAVGADVLKIDSLPELRAKDESVCSDVYHARPQSA